MQNAQQFASLSYKIQRLKKCARTVDKRKMSQMLLQFESVVFLLPLLQIRQNWLDSIYSELAAMADMTRSE